MDFPMGNVGLTVRNICRRLHYREIFTRESSQLYMYVHVHVHVYTNVHAFSY